MKRLPVLVRVLRDPSAVRDLDAAGWDLLLRQADVANLDALLLVRLEDAGLLDTVPAADATVDVELGFPEAILVDPTDSNTRKRSIKLSAARVG